MVINKIKLIIMFKVEKRPILWAVLTVFAFELSKLVFKSNYFEYFQNNTIEYFTFILLELFIFVLLAFLYKYFKNKHVESHSNNNA